MTVNNDMSDDRGSFTLRQEKIIRSRSYQLAALGRTDVAEVDDEVCIDACLRKDFLRMITTKWNSGHSGANQRSLVVRRMSVIGRPLQRFGWIGWLLPMGG